MGGGAMEWTKQTVCTAAAQKKRTGPPDHPSTLENIKCQAGQGEATMSGKEQLKKKQQHRNNTSFFPTRQIPNTYFTLNSAPESGCVKIS